ncbi:MAG: GSCFA domain-containing protein [Proteobacteria bacterium]|nr:GSCFA domain-containing protein [Pseudomonadota bacterium]
MAGPEPDVFNAVSGMAALQTSMDNPHNRFNAGAGSAAERLRARAPVEVQCRPKFPLSHGDGVFTMGSCFARNVEYALIAAGMRVLPEKWDFPSEFLHPDAAARARVATGVHHHVILRSVLNRYTPASMLNEFQRALEPDTFRAPQKGLVHIDEDQWFDPHTKDTAFQGLRESLMVRFLVDEAAKSMVQARAIFLTLGHTETWFDSETGLVLNVAPPPLLIRKSPDRFRFFNATYPDALEALEQIFALVSRHIQPSMKFIVTVSPVPLNTTFTARDIVAANTYSKSTLRAVAETFAARHDTVDYFPSYEMVMSTHPDLAWEADRMHVPQALVQSIITRFMACYFTETAPRASGKPAKMPA